MADTKSDEIDIFTEDEVGAAIVETYLSPSLRERVKIRPIGSDQAVARQLAAHYREDKKNCIAFVDGDKRTSGERLKRTVKTVLEDRVDDDFDSWIDTTLNFLPGDTWPERYIVESVMADANAVRTLSEMWEMPEDDICALLEKAYAAGKHQEFYSLASSINLELTSVRRELVLCQSKFKHNDPEQIREVTRRALHIS